MDESQETAALTEKDSLTKLIGARKGKLGACTCKMNEIKLRQSETGDVNEVKRLLTKFLNTLEEFEQANDSVQLLQPVEERKVEQEYWFKPKIDCFKRFIDEIIVWIAQTLKEVSYSLSAMELQCNRGSWRGCTPSNR